MRHSRFQNLAASSRRAEIGAPAPSSRRRSRAAGFTIFEVAMSTFVMAFGLATSIIALQMGFRAMGVARDSTLASQIMQSEIERLRLWPWSKVTPASVVDSIIELPASESVSLASTFASNSKVTSRFTVTRTVTTDPTNAWRDVRYITVTVSWKSSDGMPHNRYFTTMYAKDGLYDYYYTLAQTS
jgi:Tfp pilus assembly protein PilV